MLKQRIPRGQWELFPTPEFRVGSNVCLTLTKQRLRLMLSIQVKLKAGNFDLPDSLLILFPAARNQSHSEGKGEG